MAISLGKTVLGLSKKEFTELIRKIIKNHRVNSRLIGTPRELILKASKITDKWGKIANRPDTLVYLRTIDIARGIKVKMISLEEGKTKQPVPLNQFISALYPPKPLPSPATPEERHYGAVKTSMRFAVDHQLKEFRDSVELPLQCPLTGAHIRKGVKTDVDHFGLSFSEIADRFLEVSGLKYSDILLEGPPTARKFKDKELWAVWQEYHKLQASFALVCASANRSKGCGDYVTPKELIGSLAPKDSTELSLDF